MTTMDWEAIIVALEFAYAHATPSNKLMLLMTIDKARDELAWAQAGNWPGAKQ